MCGLSSFLAPKQTTRVRFPPHPCSWFWKWRGPEGRPGAFARLMLVDRHIHHTRSHNHNSHGLMTFGPCVRSAFSSFDRDIYMSNHRCTETIHPQLHLRIVRRLSQVHSTCATSPSHSFHSLSISQSVRLFGHGHLRSPRVHSARRVARSASRGGRRLSYLDLGGHLCVRRAYHARNAWLCVDGLGLRPFSPPKNSVEEHDRDGIETYHHIREPSNHPFYLIVPLMQSGVVLRAPRGNRSRPPSRLRDSHCCGAARSPSAMANGAPALSSVVGFLC